MRTKHFFLNLARHGPVFIWECWKINKFLHFQLSKLVIGFKFYFRNNKKPNKYIVPSDYISKLFMLHLVREFSEEKVNERCHKFQVFFSATLQNKTQ